MILPLDPFAKSFDSIEIDRAPSPAAIESAFAAIAPTAAASEDGQPGYFLLDDANGRFIVDRDMGIVMLRDETLAAREQGAIYPARLRVVEASGTSYDVDLKLRITGRVPQMVGAEDFSFGGDLPTPETPARQAVSVAWTAFAAARGLQAKPQLTAHGAYGAYGALLCATLPQTQEHIVIAFEGAPPQPPAGVLWSL